jgi:adenine-specific DNA-methyltransferase
MPDALATTPASANFQKLKDKLRELFELDKADLDFGIYRVLRQRHREIVEFLDNHLETTVREALRSHQSIQTDQVADDLAKAEAAAKAAGFAPDQSPKVQELRERLKTSGDVEAVADEVYSHLLTFFSRYYHEGDFLGLHRSTVHGREKYMIPYNGEEVKLVWANMDQYYIKSSELLRDYTFLIKKSDWLAAQAELPLGDLPEQVCVHFKLVEGDTEKDNRKASGKTTRAFALADPVCEEKDGALYINFAYREHAAERNLQDKLNADTVKTLAGALPGVWRTLLLGADPTHQPKDKKDTRTVLQKHLRAYTARHQFDYFIHKDLGAFLRRELDFYLKNEVMHLDDIENAGSAKAEEYLSKLRAIRRCATPVIRMLAQLEDFQKKLWLKKKFVVETRYCLTLDRVPEALYPEICKNDAQWQEWEELYSISELKPKRTSEFLKANPYMMLDTRNFRNDFTLKLLSFIENIDQCLDGICINSDNFQALQLLQERHKENLKCIYIDPPYNTNSAPILYKNDYKYSSWACLMYDRLLAAKTLLAPDGVETVAIDDTELVDLIKILDQISSGYRISKVTVVHNPKGSITKDFNRTHEYAIFVTPEKSADCIARTLEENDTPRKLRRWGENSLRTERRLSFYPIYIKAGKITRIGKVPSDDEFHPAGKNVLQPSGEIEVWPIDGDGVERRWNFGLDSISDNLSRIIIQESEGVFDLFLSHEMTVPKTVWSGGDYDAGNWGNSLLISMFGEKLFDFPKSIHLVKKCISLVVSADKSATVLDFFPGSGTTPHAVILINKDDGGSRKYVVAEVGLHFENVLVPRIKKVAYSTEWKDGKPQKRDTGISHAFKIIRLESYEDTLNNLVLRRTPEQEAALKAQPTREQGEYMLGYFLDVESAGSASVLDVAQFRDPFAYKLKIATSSAGETKDTPVDLVETFNWLLGLKVRHIDAPQGFVTVTGERRDGKKVLVVWRKLGADAVADNAALQRLFDKLQVNPAETSDTDYAAIYVNGAHTLADPHGKIHLTEEEFHRRMFATAEFDSLIN